MDMDTILPRYWMIEYGGIHIVFLFASKDCPLLVQTTHYYIRSALSKQNKPKGEINRLYEDIDGRIDES